MPRSFSFDHFQQAPSRPPQLPPEGDQEAYVKSHETLPESAEKLHYGKAFAETEEILRRRRAARASKQAFEELPRKGRASPERAAGQRVRDEARATPQVRTGAPIGALPVAGEAPPLEGFASLWEEAQRNVGTLTQSLRDFSDALGRLARLPVGAARLTARLTARRLKPA